MLSRWERRASAKSARRCGGAGAGRQLTASRSSRGGFQGHRGWTPGTFTGPARTPRPRHDADRWRPLQAASPSRARARSCSRSGMKPASSFGERDNVGEATPRAPRDPVPGPEHLVCRAGVHPNPTPPSVRSQPDPASRSTFTSPRFFSLSVSFRRSCLPTVKRRRRRPRPTSATGLHSHFAIRRTRSVSCSVPLRSWRALVGRGEVAVTVNEAPLAVLSAVDLRDAQPLASHRRPVKNNVTDLVANRVRQVGTLVDYLVFGGDHSLAVAAGNVAGWLAAMPSSLLWTYPLGSR